MTISSSRPQDTWRQSVIIIALTIALCLLPIVGPVVAQQDSEPDPLLSGPDEVYIKSGSDGAVLVYNLNSGSITDGNSFSFAADREQGIATLTATNTTGLSDSTLNGSITVTEDGAQATVDAVQPKPDQLRTADITFQQAYSETELSGSVDTTIEIALSGGGQQTQIGELLNQIRTTGELKLSADRAQVTADLEAPIVVALNQLAQPTGPDGYAELTANETEAGELVVTLAGERVQTGTVLPKNASENDIEQLVSGASSALAFGEQNQTPQVDVEQFESVTTQAGNPAVSFTATATVPEFSDALATAVVTEVTENSVDDEAISFTEADKQEIRDAADELQLQNFNLTLDSEQYNLNQEDSAIPSDLGSVSFTLDGYNSLLQTLIETQDMESANAALTQLQALENASVEQALSWDIGLTVTQEDEQTVIQFDLGINQDVTNWQQYIDNTDTNITTEVQTNISVATTEDTIETDGTISVSRDSWLGLAESAGVVSPTGDPTAQQLLAALGESNLTELRGSFSTTEGTQQFTAAAQFDSFDALSDAVLPTEKLTVEEVIVNGTESKQYVHVSGSNITEDTLASAGVIDPLATPVFTPGQGGDALPTADEDEMIETATTVGLTISAESSGSDNSDSSDPDDQIDNSDGSTNEQIEAPTPDDGGDSGIGTPLLVAAVGGVIIFGLVVSGGLYFRYKED